MIHESSIAGDEAANCNDFNLDSSPVVRVKTLHISSPILAAKSPFFYKVKFNCILLTLFYDQSTTIPKTVPFLTLIL